MHKFTPSPLPLPFPLTTAQPPTPKQASQAMKVTSTTFLTGYSLLLLCLAGTPTIVRGSQDMDAMDFVVSPDADHMMGEADGEANDEVFYLLAQKIGTL